MVTFLLCLLFKNCFRWQLPGHRLSWQLHLYICRGRKWQEVQQSGEVLSECFVIPFTCNSILKLDTVQDIGIKNLCCNCFFVFFWCNFCRVTRVSSPTWTGQSTPSTWCPTQETTRYCTVSNLCWPRRCKFTYSWTQRSTNVFRTKDPYSTTMCTPQC